MLERSVSIVTQVSDGNFTIGSLYNYSKKNVLPILSSLLNFNPVYSNDLERIAPVSIPFPPSLPPCHPSGSIIVRGGG